MNQDNAFSISQHLSYYSAVKKVILYGSLANNSSKKDVISDCDIGVVVDDIEFDDFKESIVWLTEYGDVFGYEKHLEDNKFTIRICYEDFSRYDISVIKESALEDKTLHEFFGNNIQIVYTDHKNEKVNKKSITKLIRSTNNVDSDKVNKFWFVSVLAYCKIMRGDYLISGHLIFELMQETIVLQMLERDAKKNTNIHRYGNKETIHIFEKLNKFSFKSDKETLFKLLKNTCQLYDEEMVKKEKSYKSKFHIFENWVNMMPLQK